MTNEREALTDELIVALNAGERFFSESPSKYPEAGHGTQYHCGLPGLLGFARAVAALSQPSPAVPIEQLATYRPVWLQYGVTMHRDVVPNEAGWLKRSDVLDLLAAPQPTEPAQPATQAGAGERYREQCAKGGRCLQGCLKAEQCFYAAPTEPAQPSREFLVPDAVWEALQRMIEDGVRRGPASREDAKAVADWRGRFWKKAEPAQPATQAGAGEMDSEHWAELFRLRNAVKGPDGYATWQDAATAERIRRVKAERALAEAAPTTEQPGDAERLRAVANIAHAGGLQGMSEGDALTAIRRLTIDHWTAHGKGGE
jgi:hypothetical protein